MPYQVKWTANGCQESRQQQLATSRQHQPEHLGILGPQ